MVWTEEGSATVSDTAALLECKERVVAIYVACLLCLRRKRHFFSLKKLRFCVTAGHNSDEANRFSSMSSM